MVNAATYPWCSLIAISDFAAVPVLADASLQPFTRLSVPKLRPVLRPTERFLNDELFLRQAKYKPKRDKVRFQLQTFAFNETRKPKKKKSNILSLDDISFPGKETLTGFDYYTTTSPKTNGVGDGIFHYENKVVFIRHGRVIEILLTEAQYLKYFDPAKGIQEMGAVKESTGQQQQNEIISSFLNLENKSFKPLATIEDIILPEIKNGSHEEDAELVSETLAELHIRQGNVKEAVRIYKKLSLLFPEKSSYFDTRIEKL